MSLGGTQHLCMMARTCRSTRHFGCKRSVEWLRVLNEIIHVALGKTGRGGGRGGGGEDYKYSENGKGNNDVAHNPA